MEDLIDRITEFLAKPRMMSMLGEGEDFELMGCRLRVVECEVHSPMTLEVLHRISIIRRDDFPIAALGPSIVYNEVGRDRESMMQQRIMNGRKLAIMLVKEFLPELSVQAKIELHNMEVEEALAWLDQE